MAAATPGWSDSPPEGWDALARDDPGAAATHRTPFARAIADSIPGMSVEYAVVERDRRLLGGAMVVCERRAGLHWLHGMPFLLSGAPLACPGAHAEVDREVAALLAARARQLRVVGGEWVGYRPTGAPLDPACLEAIPGETRVVETAIVDLTEGLEAAWRRIERHTRQELAHARRSGIEVTEGAQALEEAYALYCRQAREWSGHRPLPLELSRRLLATSGAVDGIQAEEPIARLFAARDARGLLASALVTCGTREVMPWWSGSHPDARRRHAFALLLWSVVEWAAARGCTRVNLGASAGQGAVEEFKQTLGARGYRFPVRWFSDAHAPWPGRLAAWLQGRLWRGRARGEPA